MRACLMSSLFLFATACTAPTTSSPVGDTAAAVATAASPVHAQLYFQVGWTQLQRGALVRGGHVDVTYDRARMGGCSSATIFAFARFSPGGQQFSSDEAFGFDVPGDATAVDLWFHAVSPDCDQWDSDYGHNWRFPVVATAPAAVGWAGDWGSSTDRACTHAAGVPQPITIDEYMRERACIFIDADVWIPGMTDVSRPAPRVHPRPGLLGERQRRAGGQAARLPGHRGTTRASAGASPYEVRNLADWSLGPLHLQLQHRRHRWTSRFAQPPATTARSSAPSRCPSPSRAPAAAQWTSGSSSPGSAVAPSRRSAGIPRSRPPHLPSA